MRALSYLGLPISSLEGSAPVLLGTECWIDPPRQFLVAGTNCTRLSVYGKAALVVGGQFGEEKRYGEQVLNPFPTPCFPSVGLQVSVA